MSETAGNGNKGGGEVWTRQADARPTGRRLADTEVGPEDGRRRWPQVGLGLLLVVGLALGAVVWHASSTARQPVLALAEDLARGQVVDSSDLRVVDVGAEEAVQLLGREQAGEVLGKAAVADLTGGTLVAPGLFRAAPTLAEGAVRIGVAVPAGAMPSPQLGVGDVVELIHVDDGQGRRLAQGQVAAVTETGTRDSRVVSVQVDGSVAGPVAEAAAAEQLRLIQLPAGGPSS